MTHDYKDSKIDAAPATSGGHGFLWGLVIGLSVAAFLWFQNKDTDDIAAAQPAVPTTPQLGAQPAALAANNPAAAAVSEPIVEPAAADETDEPPVRKSRFAFYKLLRDFEVIIPEEEIALNAPPPVPEAKPVPDAGDLNLSAGNQYKVQIGSFRSSKDAERRRAEVGLLGLTTGTQTVEISPGQTWNRVYVGPLTDPREIEDTLDILAGNGYDFLVTKVKIKPSPAPVPISTPQVELEPEPEAAISPTE